VCGAFVCFAIIGVPKLFGWGPAALGLVHWGVAVILVVREAYVTILRHRAEARGINFAAVRLGKIKMFVQVFAIGTVLIKVAHVPAAWGHWFTLAVFVLMVVITVVSGLQATRRVRTPVVC
jgi:phosphatidylglycerophosphate synthase